MDQALSREQLNLQPLKVVERLTPFYSTIDEKGLDAGGVAALYYKAALQASNDRINRVRRGMIIGGLIRQFSDDEILRQLRQEGLA